MVDNPTLIYIALVFHFSFSVSFFGPSDSLFMELADIDHLKTQHGTVRYEAISMVRRLHQK